MASSPLITTPTSLDDLPPELRCTLTEYLGDKDLCNMRLLSDDWNTIAKETLLKRKRFIFNFENLNKLVQFNDCFAAYIPTSDIAAGRFCFKRSALDTAAAKWHLDTFVQNFGHLVTRLSVDLSYPKPPSLYRPIPYRRRNYVIEPPQPGTVRYTESETVLAHVTLLLHGVKGQVQDLELLTYAGLRPCVIGNDPFPRLRTLTVGHGSTRPPLDQAVLEEGTILLLCRKVPAVQRFDFQGFHGANGGDPSFLPNVLRNLVGVNAEVEVKLDMDSSSSSQNPDEERALFQQLLTAAVRIVGLALVVRGGVEALRAALTWIGAQSAWLRKLKLQADLQTLLGGLTMPSLRALEELEYVQETVDSLLEYNSPDYFPSLRKVTTASTGNDFTVALPQVTDLTLVRSWSTGWAPWRQGRYGQALFQLPPFPNIESLTCHPKFIDLGSMVKLKSLTRLRVTQEEESRNICCFWKRLTHGARRLTLEQIRALPEPAENAVRERVEGEPSFTELTNLKELTLVAGDEVIALLNLDAVLWISKTLRLQRLEKLEIELAKRNCLDIPQVYLEELRKYHNSVFVSQPKIGN